MSLYNLYMNLKFNDAKDALLWMAEQDLTPEIHSTLFFKETPLLHSKDSLIHTPVSQIMSKMDKLKEQIAEFYKSHPAYGIPDFLPYKDKESVFIGAAMAESLCKPPVSSDEVHRMAMAAVVAVNLFMVDTEREDWQTAALMDAAEQMAKETRSCESGEQFIQDSLASHEVSCKFGNFIGTGGTPKENYLLDFEPIRTEQVKEFTIKRERDDAGNPSFSVILDDVFCAHGYEMDNPMSSDKAAMFQFVAELEANGIHMDFAKLFQEERITETAYGMFCAAASKAETIAAMNIPAFENYGKIFADALNYEILSQIPDAQKILEQTGCDMVRIEGGGIIQPDSLKQFPLMHEKLFSSHAVLYSPPDAGAKAFDMTYYTVPEGTYFQNAGVSYRLTELQGDCAARDLTEAAISNSYNYSDPEMS